GGWAGGLLFGVQGMRRRRGGGFGSRLRAAKMFLRTARGSKSFRPPQVRDATLSLSIERGFPRRSSAILVFEWKTFPPSARTWGLFCTALSSGVWGQHVCERALSLIRQR